MADQERCGYHHGPVTCARPSYKGTGFCRARGHAPKSEKVNIRECPKCGGEEGGCEVCNFTGKIKTLAVLMHVQRANRRRL